MSISAQNHAGNRQFAAYFPVTTCNSLGLLGLFEALQTPLARARCDDAKSEN
ncbi:Uncharacterised protein [Vibrio cholerae]|nr:Uncharacterised protein [Vibrio cholerae]